MMASARANAPARHLDALLAMDTGHDVTVSGLSLDSRQTRGGDLFLALAGTVHDGRQFMEQAVANGAVAVVAEAPAGGFADALPVPLVELPELHLEAGPIAARFYGEPSRAMHMIGVTGTNGKTTTSRLVGQLLRLLNGPCGVIGTLGASLDESVQATANTTPDPLSLQACLSRWCERGVSSVAMEVSSHALVQGRVNGVSFDTALFTNLSHEHLDYHGSMADYAAAKGRLFSWDGLANGLVNADDEWADTVAARAGAGTRILRYSATGKPGADLCVEQAEFYPGGVRGRLRTPWGGGEFHSPLPGVFNLANLLAAVGAVALAGHSLGDVLARLPELHAVPGRLQAVPNALGIQVLVDYAHTPDALEKVLRALRPQVEGALITVFGCGGDRDADKRPLMGRIACSLSDRVVVTSDNPRGEDPEAILADILAGCSGAIESRVARDEAIAEAIAGAQAGDCVLIAGKGHEDYQEVAGRRLPFSDSEQAAAALARRAAS